MWNEAFLTINKSYEFTCLRGKKKKRKKRKNSYTSPSFARIFFFFFFNKILFECLSKGRTFVKIKRKSPRPRLIPSYSSCSFLDRNLGHLQRYCTCSRCRACKDSLKNEDAISYVLSHRLVTLSRLDILETLFPSFSFHSEAFFRIRYSTIARKWPGFCFEAHTSRVARRQKLCDVAPGREHTRWDCHRERGG